MEKQKRKEGRTLDQKPELKFGWHWLTFIFSDTRFDHYGKLEKKDKRGKYVMCKSYLNKEYFGFLNLRKSRIVFTNS